jgi:hypothetical protein
MSNSSGPLPLKTLRLKPLREEEMMFSVGASTSGVRRLQRRRPPSPPSRRKTKRGLREEGIMRRKRKEKPILQVLLIASLAINTTLSFVVLANRNRMGQPTGEKESVAAPAVITLEDAKVESKVPTVANSVSQPAPWVAKKTVAPEATMKRNAPAKTEIASRERDEISFFPTPTLYRLQRDTVLVTRRNGVRILIPQGTLVRVAGITPDDKALVVSRKGNPDGLIARSSLEQIADERIVPDSSASLQKATVTAPPRAADTSGPFRLSGGPYGGSIGLGGAQIFVGPNGQVSGSLSR